MVILKVTHSDAPTRIAADLWRKPEIRRLEEPLQARLPRPAWGSILKSLASRDAG